MSKLDRMCADDGTAGTSHAAPDAQALAAAWRRRFGADAGPLLVLAVAELERHDPRGDLALTRAVLGLLTP
jgi:hypothetical protein